MPGTEDEWKEKDVILVGDIGGTNTRLAIMEMLKGHFTFLAEETFPSREELSLESAIRKFLSKPLHLITWACFGVAKPVREGSVLVEAIAAAVCGTDVEIAEGKYGWAPPGRTRLVLGHESLGRKIPMFSCAAAPG